MAWLGCDLCLACVARWARPGWRRLWRKVGRALTLCFKMRRCALLLALCGLALLAQARAMTMAPAPGPLGADGKPMSGDLLLPETDNDVVALLSHLMSAQHEVVLATHGKVR